MIASSLAGWNWSDLLVGVLGVLVGWVSKHLASK
jgi:hypothetical protein